MYVLERLSQKIFSYENNLKCRVIEWFLIFLWFEGMGKVYSIRMDFCMKKGLKVVLWLILKGVCLWLRRSKGMMCKYIIFLHYYLFWYQSVCRYISKHLEWRDDLTKVSNSFEKHFLSHPRMGFVKLFLCIFPFHLPGGKV